MGKVKTYVWKILLTIGLTAIGSVGLMFLFWGIFFYSWLFTLNDVYSGILAMVITTGLVVSFGTYALYKRARKKEG